MGSNVRGHGVELAGSVPLTAAIFIKWVVHNRLKNNIFAFFAFSHLSQRCLSRQLQVMKTYKSEESTTGIYE